jgi:hypothetical protein
MEILGAPGHVSFLTGQDLHPNIVKSPESGRENVRFQDNPDFENLLDFRTGRDVR